ncbi:MAG: transcriptional repressor [Angelakisella sp.]
MKYSRQRELILNTVQSFPIHPTADTVYESVRQKEPKISLGTVYRNLNQLSEVGMLLKLPMPSGGDRFDGRLDDHLHIICSRCGAVADIELSALSQLDNDVEHQTGYRVTGRSMVFSGVCGECHKKS